MAKHVSAKELAFHLSLHVTTVGGSPFFQAGKSQGSLGRLNREKHVRAAGVSSHIERGFAVPFFHNL